MQVASLGKYGSAPGELRHPTSVAATSRDTILVSERLNKRVQELTPDGAHVRTYGSRTPPHSGAPPVPEEGVHIPGGSALLGEPRGVATCARGHVYAVDAVAGKPGRVLVWDADGRAVRALGPAIAGSCRVLGDVDGAMLDPVGVCIAPGSEHVWVSHRLAASAVRGGSKGDAPPVWGGGGATPLCVVSCFCARTGAWRGVVAGTHLSLSPPPFPSLSLSLSHTHAHIACTFSSGGHRPCERSTALESGPACKVVWPTSSRKGHQSVFWGWTAIKLAGSSKTASSFGSFDMWPPILQGYLALKNRHPPLGPP